MKTFHNNVVYHRATNFHRFYYSITSRVFSTPNHASSNSRSANHYGYGSYSNLQKMNCNAAAKLYNIPEPTLRARITGRPSRRDIRSNCIKLSELKTVIGEYILDMDTRGFAPRLAGVEDMANYLLETRRAKHIGKLWAHRSVC
jgi:hypothetical protein